VTSSDSETSILDGEVLAVNAEGYADFRLLMRGQANSTTSPSISCTSTAVICKTNPSPNGSAVWIGTSHAHAGALASARRAYRRPAALRGGSTTRSGGHRGKRKADPYGAGVTWYKIKNRAYTQMEGRGDLFHGPC
jgi:hypothetical protein